MIMNDEGMIAPKRATHGSAGYDIYMPYDEVFKPGEFVTVDTGIRFNKQPKFEHPILPQNLILQKHIFVKDKIVSECKEKIDSYETILSVVEPANWVALVFPRSSFGFEYGLRFANTICVIDQDYNDTIKLKITVDKELKISCGERIAQMIFIPYLMLVDEERPSKSRDGGIGSTGR